MRFEQLSDWLAWQEHLHPNPIDLGLDRCAAVAARMQLTPVPFRIVSVAGTNGKGSCVAFMEAMLCAAGVQVGTYTSPHLLCYNERIRVNGKEVEDRVLVDAFDAVDGQRAGTSLTYFEFGTLAAMSIFKTANPEVVLLEVGLGGRLDAVNLFDADVALMGPIGVDHTDWLGFEREAIGVEKAGILRAGRPAVCVETDPPGSVIDHAKESGVPLYRGGREFRAHRRKSDWDWLGPENSFASLPYPALAGVHQVDNAAAAIMALSLLGRPVGLDSDCVRGAMAQVRLLGRFQVLRARPEVIVDVAHNVQAAQALARTLRERVCRGTRHALLAMRSDKDIEGVASAMRDEVDEWHLAGLSVPSGASRESIQDRLRAVLPRPAATAHDQVESAYRYLREAMRADDRLIVFGSFHTVAEVLRLEG